MQTKELFFPIGQDGIEREKSVEPRLSFLLSLCLLIACGPGDPKNLPDIRIINVNIIDSEIGLIKNQTVVIDDQMIIQVGDATEMTKVDANKTVDGTGKYLMPGLWDAHVHFAYIEELAPSMFNLFLAYGITSVRDTGGKIDFVRKWKNMAQADPTAAPRIMIAGPLLDGLPNVYDGSSAMVPELSVGLGTVEDVEHQVAMLDSLEVDLLKAYEMLTPEQFERVAEMGKNRGLKVTGHVPLSMSVIAASDAGLSSLEHMRNLELACAGNADQLLEQRRTLLNQGKNDPGGVLRSRIHSAQRQNAVENYDDLVADQVLAVLAKNETWQIPTLALNLASTDRQFMREDFRESFAYLPDSIESAWRNNSRTFAESEIPDFQQTYREWKLNMVKKIHDAKIPMMAGTDCPIFFLTPGRSLHLELESLVEAGLTPLEAIQTATQRPAEYFDIDDKLGFIKTGMEADLLLLDANPLEDIKNTMKINSVFRAGRHYDRNALDGLLE